MSTNKTSHDLAKAITIDACRIGSEGQAALSIIVYNGMLGILIEQMLNQGYSLDLIHDMVDGIAALKGKTREEIGELIVSGADDPD